jgi:transposase
MLRDKARTFKNHTAVSLESLVPQNHFYRQLEAKLDLSFIRELVAGLYSTMGRPSIDPVVFFKLQLIMFFESIRSERQLMEQVQVNLAHRWYIGYDLDEAVPDHSSLSKIRDRYGLEVFQRFFEAIVERCCEAGLVWGKELYFDGTQVRANADPDQQVPRFYWQARQHMHTLFGSTRTERKMDARPRGLVHRYNGQRIVGKRTHSSPIRQSDLRVCPTDPDASPLYGQNGHHRLGYHLHYVVDGGRARIILAALVTPASVMDNTPMLDLERWVCFRWQLRPRFAVADTKYGTLDNIVGLEQDGLRAYVAVADPQIRTKVYSQEQFDYDDEHDRYRCPQGQWLALSSFDQYQQTFMYRTSPKICNACPVKPACTTSRYGRVVRRSIFQSYLDRVRAYRSTPVYRKALRKRSVWIEPMFGEAKQWHHLEKFRWRGLIKVNIQGLLTAAGQNIKRLLKAWMSQKPLKPTGSAVLSLVSELAFYPFRCGLLFQNTFSTG